jgi:hypothetical protein
MSIKRDTANISRKKPLLPDSHPAAVEMEQHLRSNENRSDHQRSNERRNGIVEPPPAWSPGAEEDGSPNERRRRNGITGAPFLHALLASPHHHQTDDSRSR